MDGTTDPFIAILGHPIAANPSQFALERALQQMELEWRVLSFEVPPQKIATALDGLDVLGVNGILIDQSVAEAASSWYRSHRPGTLGGNREDPNAQAWQEDGTHQVDQTAAEPQKEPGSPSEADLPRRAGSVANATIEQTDGDQLAVDRPVDCFHRQDGRLVGCFQQQIWLERQLPSDTAASWICIGQSDSPPRLAQAVDCQCIDLPIDPAHLATANIILLAEPAASSSELELNDWPAAKEENDSPARIVVDLFDTIADHDRFQARGYRVINNLERRIGTIELCLRCWTGQSPPHDVLCDAVEEFFGV